MFRIICLIIGYCIGCIQTAYYVGRLVGKIDVREHGSGNAGTTNVVRTVGLKAGLITFVCDVLKAVFVYLLCSFLWKGTGTFYTYTGDGVLNGLLPGLYGGFGLIVGHCYPVQLRFKGGKGVASTLGVFWCINPVIAWISFGVGIVVILTTRFVSLTSLAISVVFAAQMLFSGYSKEEIAISVIFAIMVFYRHRENIQRLLTGNERKISVKKKE